MRYYFKQRVLVVLAFVLIAAGCAREANQNQPVVTTTNTGTTTAPPAKQETGEKNALIRLVDALPDSSGIDLFADDTRVLLNVPYKEVSHYREIPTGRRAFTIRPLASAVEVPPLAKENEIVSSGNHYTAVATVATSGSTPSSLNIFSDDLTPPPTGKAKVRVIHAAPDADELDVYAAETNNRNFGGVNPVSATDYTEVGPATVTLEVRSEGDETALTALPNVKFDAGKIYTVVVLGRLKGTPKLEAVLIEDQLGSGPPQ